MSDHCVKCEISQLKATESGCDILLHCPHIRVRECERCERNDIERSCFLGIALKSKTRWLCANCADLYFEMHERFFEDFIYDTVSYFRE